MKKIFSCVLCLAMMLSMGTVAFAETSLTTDGGSHDVTVTYGMDEGFTVTIPTNFTIDATKKATADVSASNVMIAYGKVLEVAISGDDYATTGSWELVDEAEAENMLTYTIGTTEDGFSIVNNSVILSVGAGEAYNDTVEKTMYFTVIDTLSKAGTYKDTLTFTVSVEEVRLISFTVAGAPYQAEKGMTWREWITANPELSATNTFVIVDEWIDAFQVGTMEYDSGEVVNPDDLIIENANYIVLGM